ncbi:hypothetical protein LDENG_00071850 [Lucifuga dentata]|nr:hypothetical protein LDENG_00071850 [Lucifuga dentata]
MNGVLTIPGFKKIGAACTKQKKILSLDHESRSSSKESEEQSEKKANTDDVEDEDRGSTALEWIVETEEEEEEGAEDKPGNEDEDSEAERKVKEEGHDNEVIPLAHDKDNNTLKGNILNSNERTVEESRTLRTLKMCRERLSEILQKCKHAKEEENDEDIAAVADNKDNNAFKGGTAKSYERTVGESTTLRTLKMCHERLLEKCTSTNKGKGGAARAPGTSASPVIMSAPDDKFSIPNVAADTASITNQSPKTFPVLPINVTGIIFTDDWEDNNGKIESEMDYSNANNNHIHVSRSEVSGQSSASGNFKEECDTFIKAPIHTDASLMSHSPTPVSRSGKEETREETTRKQELDEALVDMVVKDYQPFSVVEDESLRAFVGKLDPTYTLPTKNSLKHMVEKKYKALKEKVKEDMKKVICVSLTSDIWTSKNMDVFMGIICHFVQQGKLQS